MIRSMTGFASVSREEQGRKVGVTVKSVNHRFLDVALKLPNALGGVEGGDVAARPRAQHGEADRCVRLGGHEAPPSAASSGSGSWMAFTSQRRKRAASAPSTTRWSKESESAMRRRGCSSSLS